MKDENSKLQQIISYASFHVPFYKNLTVSNCDYTHLPIIEKISLQKESGDFVSDEYDDFPKSEDVVIQRTSGSTGIYLSIRWDKNDINHSLKEIWLLRKRYYGISPEDKFCSFYTNIYTNGKIDSQNNEIALRTPKGLYINKNYISLENIENIYNRILNFEPVWIMTQPSLAFVLGQYIQNNALPHIQSLKYMELTGEMLPASNKNMLENIFQCSVASQYGAQEVGPIAFECPFGRMHQISSNVYMETITTDVARPTAPKEIIVTGLSNHATPILKYRINDCGDLHNDCVCECGNPNPVLTLTQGRSNDVILTDNKEYIDAYLFVRPIEFINETIGKIIRQFQIVQCGYKNFLVKLVLHPVYKGWKSTVAKLFVENIKHPYLAQCKYNFEFSEVLFPMAGGKLAFFIRDFTT